MTETEEQFKDMASLAKAPAAKSYPKNLRKERKCKVCKTKFIRAKPLQVVCSWQCGLALAEKKREQEVAKKLRNQRKDSRERVLNLKPIQYWLKRTQKACNDLVRIIEADLPCAACGATESLEWHSSHFISVGASSALRFDLANIHKCCVKCNVFLAGNLINYEIRLRAMIGDSEVERLKTAQSSRIWTREELWALEAEFKSRAKQLQKENYRARTNED